jgi:hypothetical protein
MPSNVVEASPQEAVLLALEQEFFDPAVSSVLSGLQDGASPSFMSIIRPDLLFGLSEELLPAMADVSQEDPAESYKTELFRRAAIAAAEGDPAAISALPKFATSLGELLLATELTLDNREAIAAWRTGRPQVQYIGSFNPQHIGHRATMRSALLAAGEQASGIVQVVQNHPIKKDALPPYEGRYAAGEERLYSSRLIDPTRVTQVDVPLGVGLAKVGAAQIELLADVAGDEEMRWLVGSDKFMTDYENVRDGKALDKAGARFEHPRTRLYVARRAIHDPAELEQGINYIVDRYRTKITMVEESPEDVVLGASASLIRSLRASGNNAEADRLEFPDRRAVL